MTTKEFNRRIQFFSSLDSACRSFNTGKTFIYKVSVCYKDGTKSNFFWDFPSLALSDKICACNYLYFDKFDINQFNVYFKYFESFYLRCSNNQRNILRSSSSFSALLSLLDNASSK